MGTLSIGGHQVTIGARPVNFIPQDPQIYVSPTVINATYDGDTYTVYLCGACWNTATVTDACTWITPSQPDPPSAPPGTAVQIAICTNSGAARSGVVCFIPQSGCATKCVTICQSAAVLASHCVNFVGICCSSGTHSAYALDSITSSPAMAAGDCYNASFSWALNTGTAKVQSASVSLYCNGVSYCTRSVAVANATCSGTWSNINIKSGETWRACLIANAGYTGADADACITLTSVTGVVGCYCRGTLYSRIIFAICGGILE